MKGHWSWTALITGVVAAVVLTASNVYLGLYAGMTVSASIPAAVMAMAVFRVLQRRDVHGSNLVQTMASAGESLAAGVIFTVPALVLTQAWHDFKYWPTTLIAMCGGLLGVAFMIPLRRSLMTDSKDLSFPEGSACAAVLRSGARQQPETSSGVKFLVYGAVLGGLVKAGSAWMGIIRGSLEAAFRFQERIFFAGTEVSAALVAVGFIVRLRVASQVFLGGAVGWWLLLPLASSAEGPAVEAAWGLWSAKVRYAGVGAMIVGGVYSLIVVLGRMIQKGSETGASGASGASGGAKTGFSFQGLIPEKHNDLPLVPWILLLVLTAGGVLIVYQFFLGNWLMALAAALLMIIASFLFVSVSSYVTGLVGSSNNPVSGMTISALLATGATFYFLGWGGMSAILATLGVSAVVCCAACTAGDCAQDLKTGYIVGTPPRQQQIAQLIGVIIPAFTIAPVLTLLHNAYGIGTGLKAPQATLFASLAEGFFAGEVLPVNWIVLGVAIGFLVLCLNFFLHKMRIDYHIHLMALAVGIYLPLSLSVPIFVGGVLYHLFIGKKILTKKPEAPLLAASGLIAGEALMGVGVAVWVYFGLPSGWATPPGEIAVILSVMILFAVGWLLYRSCRTGD